MKRTFMKRAFGIFFASCAAVLICSPARATTTYSIQPSTVTAPPGAAGAFDVVLTNNGPSSITVAGFNFEVSVTDPDITLTGADFSTGSFTYIFAGQSLDQDLPIPLNYTSGQTLDANDVSDASGVTLASGASVALGDVLFSVSLTAATGPFTVSFTGTPAPSDGNNLSDPGGNPINVDSFTGGTIDVAVPEPSSLLLALGGAAALMGLSPRGWRRSRTVSQLRPKAD